MSLDFEALLLLHKGMSDDGDSASIDISSTPSSSCSKEGKIARLIGCEHAFVEDSDTIFCTKCGICKDVFVTAEDKVHEQESIFSKGGVTVAIDSAGRRSYIQTGEQKKGINLRAVFNDMQAALKETNVTEKQITDACILFKKLLNGQSFRGEHRNAAMAVCIYYVLCADYVPIDDALLREMFNVKQTKYTNAYQLLISFLAKQKKEDEGEGRNTDRCVTIGVDDQDHIIGRYADLFGLTPAERQVAINMGQRYRRNRHMMTFNNTPDSVSAGLVAYVAVVARRPIPPADLQQYCRVNPATINKVLVTISKYEKKLVTEKERLSIAA